MSGRILLRGRALVIAAIVLVAAGVVGAQSTGKPYHWVGTWATSQQLVEPQNLLAPEDLHDSTLRQVVHVSMGGGVLRVHLSNVFGTAPLHLTTVHIAKAMGSVGGKIDVATDKALSFGGAQDVTIPAGAEYISDAVEFAVAPLSDIAVTLHMDEAPAKQTGHPGSRATSYLVHGDAVSAAELTQPKMVEHWYLLAAVDVAGPVPGKSIVTLGDSITDGHGATTNGNNRWPDVLARRLQADASMRAVGVLNAGIGGNRLLLDGAGPNALARFDRDVLVPASVAYVMVFEGVNDLGVLTRDGAVSKEEHDAMVHQITSAYAQMIEKAHAHGIKVIGATITPYTGSDYYHPAAENEADREAINQWIRMPGHFDAVVDFDKVVRDPAHPTQLLPSYDSGDHLHPSVAGYEAMGSAIPLPLFTK
jgi:lysophospholipase L1-like esterase